jgi:putative aminopeptidase FrvX
MKEAHKKLLLDLLALPTAPFNEQYIVDFVRRWAAQRKAVSLTQDRFGNLLLRIRRGNRSTRPLVLAAHMDHPGFEAKGMVSDQRLRAIWRGGVPPEYFEGAGVRFFSDGRWSRGRIVAVEVGLDRGRRRVKTADIEVQNPVARGAVGMWDFPDPVIRHQRIHARGCDDVAGVAAVLAAMDDLTGGRKPVDFAALLTRAEEVGFAGALAACRSGLIPRTARIISVECSSELPGARMGEGPILRVGDRTAIFSAALTEHCGLVAADLAASDEDFTFQRKLMDGGTCEASAFLGRGFETTGLCIALGNYHNVNARSRRLGPEYVDLGDFEQLIRWFVALATSRRPYRQDLPSLQAMLDHLERRDQPLLEQTASRVTSSPT